MGKTQIRKGSLRYIFKLYNLSDISDSTQFFSDGIESNDVIQGYLGDCWTVSALPFLATKDYLLRGVFREDILADKLIDSEENTMMSVGVCPPVFHSFGKKMNILFQIFRKF